MRKTAIVGVGAIGSVMGAYMTRGGGDVTLIGQWPQHVDALQRQGLSVEGPRGSFKVQVKALLLDELERLDGALELVFVVVKSNDTERVAHRLLPHLSDDAWVVSVQNGFNEDRLGRVVGAQRVLGAIITLSAELLVPGKVVEHSGLAQALMGSKLGFIVGEVDGRITPRVKEVARALEPVAEVRITSDLMLERWSKVITNCMGGVTEAITGMNSWGTRSNPSCRRLMVLLGAEAARVSLACGYRPESVAGGVTPEVLAAAATDEGARRQVEEALLRGTDTVPQYPPISSTLQDLLRGRPTEIDYLNGFVVAKARELGIPMPVNEAVIALTREMEAGKWKPGPENLQMLAPLLESPE